jgi:GDP/GTP exchange factor required for growth at low temperature
MINNATLADVETTNWNAVKLLATQYGIQLRPLEEIQASSFTCASSADAANRGIEVADLGVGTPFKITAQTGEGGRVVYRFKWRGKDDTAELASGDRDEFEFGSSETGYDPGSDSPPSSWGRKSGQRKQSTRTLKTARSIPLLQMISSMPSGSSTSSSPIEEKGKYVRDADNARQADPKIQRGDVLGAILGLREGVSAQDYAWMDGRREDGVAEKQKSPKGKGKDKLAESARSPDFTRPARRKTAWQTMTPFGEPVLHRRRTASREKRLDWGRSPIQQLTNLGQPLFSEVEDVFHDASLPLEDGDEPGTPPLEDAHDGTLIFDVLQRYTIKGLDALDERDSRLFFSPLVSSSSRTHLPSSASEVLGASIVADKSGDEAAPIKVTPGDDPRFALWATRSRDDHETLVVSGRDGIFDHVPPSPKPSLDSSSNSVPGTPTSPKRFSLRTPNSANSSRDAAHSSGNLSSSQRSFTLPMSSGHAVLLAASTSCLVAELTSRIDSQLLTDFFYTYRAYLSSQELLDLLILRLDWAIATPNGSKDEARRKIVRVRTYVVIKYWLSNFFEVDFVPNRALRTQLTDWLNAPGQYEGTSIIKSLKKIVRGLKKGYEQGGVGAILLSDAFHSPDLCVGDQMDSDARTSDGSKLILEWEDNSRHDEKAFTKNTDSLKKAPLPVHHAPPPLPNSQGAISRAFVTTVGKLSRIKRNLNSRSTASPQSNHGYYGEERLEGIDMDANDGGDLLFVRGGLENYLKYFNLHSAGEDKSEEDQASDSTTAQETPSLSTTSHQTSSTPASSIDLGSRARGNEGYAERTSSLMGQSASLIRADGRDAGYGLGISHEESEDGEVNNLTHANLAKTAQVELLHHFQSDQTLRSVSTAQPTETAESPKSKSSHRKAMHRRQVSKSSSRGQANIVQIDDIDSSSDEDDGMVRRALRRLPGARNLRMANHVRDLETESRNSLDSMSVASFGRVYPPSHRSMGSYFGKGGPNAAESTRTSLDDASWPPLHDAPITMQKIGTVQTEMLDPDEALVGYELVKGFRLDQLDSDDEEPGDVEAALRRLEGFIDQDKQKEKARKVEAMWQRSRAQQDAKEEAEKRATSRQSAPSAVLPDRADQESTKEQSFDPSTLNRKAKTQTAMPFSNSFRLTAASTKNTPTATMSRLLTPAAPVHRSFLLNHRSEVIAQQFCLIESELFKAVTWQELVSDQWRTRHYPGQVLNWESFYQASVRRKVEASDATGQVSNVEAIVARFNLTCNWVASEIVLTRHVDERAAVMCKLIRIAWKCYHHCNFASLTQIILGLQSPWVERLSKTWSRVGMLEMRMLKDLKAFINPARNFKHLRTAMRDMIVQGGMMDLITSSGPPRSGASKTSQSLLRLSDGCIPFFGLFLSDLAVNDTLPTFVEPSSPNSAIKLESSTGHLASLADPTAFAHLPPLPEQIQLTPLVNLYKYRIIAVTVKSVLAFQERLTSFEFEADANVYVKTLRIRCLEGEQLTQISHYIEP